MAPPRPQQLFALTTGQVTIREVKVKYDVPRVLEQIDSIAQCFRQVQDKTEWVVTTDVDEFYFSRYLYWNTVGPWKPETGMGDWAPASCAPNSLRESLFAPAEVTLGSS